MSGQMQFSDIASLCGSLNCVAYALAVDAVGCPALEWHEGSISGNVAVPIGALLSGSLDAGERERVRAHLGRLLEGNRSEIDLLWRGNATTIWIRDAAQPEFDRLGRVVRIVGSVQGIAQEVWQRSGGTAARKEQIFEHLDFGLSFWDLDEKLVLVNRRFSDLHPRLSGASRPGVTARGLAVALARSREVVIEGSRKKWVAEVLADFRRERPSEHLLADGRWIETTAIRFDEGSILRVVDITFQKGGERALRLAKEIAESANLKKSRFLRAANHDLRQPLATLKILIYSSFGIEDEAKRHELLHSMDVTVGIMDEILGSLLQIGQLDAGRIAARVAHFQIQQVLDRLKIEFSPQAEAKGLEMRVVACRETVESDRALLERILSNFIANAIRFTEVGSILVGVRRRGSELEIGVWDTGCGIPADQLELIFEEFHQVADLQRSGQRGLGLGLNIAYRLSQLLGHQIGVRSRLGRGSVFSVRVPMGNIWQSDLGEPEISERIGGEFLGIKVLVVEDNELLRRTVCNLLERWGVQVVEASDADKALAIVTGGQRDFDLALLDYRLPNGRAGTDVLSDLRAISGRELPGIVATADNDPALIGRIRAQGLPVLIKPINPARLRSAMHHLLYEQDHPTFRTPDA